jgi:queuine tRNA-ribosyltransferase
VRAQRAALHPPGRLNLRNATHARDGRAPDPDCGCYTCRTHSRAYLRHLFAADELLALRLATLHNLHHYLELMRGARAAIEEHRYAAFSEDVRRRESGRAPSAESGRATGLLTHGKHAATASR